METALSSYLSNSKVSGRSKNASRSKANARRPPSATDESIVASRQVLALFAAKDLEALIGTAFDVIRAAVACNFATAFYRSGGDGLLKARDSLGRARP